VGAAAPPSPRIVAQSVGAGVGGGAAVPDVPAQSYKLEQNYRQQWNRRRI